MSENSTIEGLTIFHRLCPPVPDFAFRNAHVDTTFEHYRQ